MRPARSLLALLALVAAGTSSRAVAVAGPDPRLDQVVVKVGDKALTVGDVERRLRNVPRFQLATFGSTPDEVKKAFVAKVLVPELLFAAGARDRKLDETPKVRARIDDTLRTVRLSALRGELASAGGVTEADVKKYFDDNRARFESPARVQIWRILCKTKDEAAEVVAEAKKVGTPATWAALAREHSQDKTSLMRAGNLGFVTPEGVSSDDGVTVPPAVVAAAAKLKDGEMSAEPFAEGDGFSVVWRRASMPAIKRTFDQEMAAIRQVLIRDRADKGTKELLAKLRETNLRSYNPQLVELVALDDRGNAVAPGGSVRPPSAPRSPSVTAPSATPHGLR